MRRTSKWLHVVWDMYHPEFIYRYTFKYRKLNPDFSKNEFSSHMDISYECIKGREVEKKILTVAPVSVTECGY